MTELLAAAGAVIAVLMSAIALLVRELRRRPASPPQPSHMDKSDRAEPPRHLPASIATEDDHDATHIPPPPDAALDREPDQWADWLDARAASKSD